MAVVVKAPNPCPIECMTWPAVFLAGSIDMGKAENWQERLEKELADYDILIYNPRRDDWDSTWEQSITNPQFREQVEWELNQIQHVDLTLFYFDPNGPAPITLMELGLCAGQGSWALVCCPDGYWRKGNVEVLTERCEIELVSDIETFITKAKEYVEEMIGD